MICEWSLFCMQPIHMSYSIYSKFCKSPDRNAFSLPLLVWSKLWWSRYNPASLSSLFMWFFESLKLSLNLLGWSCEILPTTFDSSLHKLFSGKFLADMPRYLFNVMYCVVAYEVFSFSKRWWLLKISRQISLFFLRKCLESTIKQKIRFYYYLQRLIVTILLQEIWRDEKFRPR